MDLRELKNQSRLIYSNVEINQALDAMAKEIEKDFSGKPVLFLTVLVGAIPTVAALTQRISLPLKMDYIHATRYGNELSGRELQWKALPQSPLKNTNIIVVDDIFDEGYTLKAIVEYCKNEGASTVKTAVLVNKDHQRKVADFSADYFGLSVPDEYVFGFGMDCKGLGRNLDSIYALQSSNSS